VSDFLRRWTTIVAAAADSPPSDGRKYRSEQDSMRASSPGRFDLRSTDMGRTLVADIGGAFFSIPVSPLSSSSSLFFFLSKRSPRSSDDRKPARLSPP
jgi:hypothetical protein